MDLPSPAPWSLAARANYFGDQVCGFCAHHAPARAKFCHECGSPLQLKPCRQCHAVNHHAATSCYQCGAEYPALVSIGAGATATPVPDAPSCTMPDEACDVTSTGQPVARASGGWRLLAPGQFLLVYFAMILVAGAYAASRFNAATQEAIAVAAQPIDVDEQPPPAAAAVVPQVAEQKPAESEATAVPEARVPDARAKIAKRASARQRPLPVRVTKRAATRQSAVAEPDPWNSMHVSLAQCDGDLFTRIACDQRMRRRFCEGRWGEVPECTSGVANDRGQ